MALDSLHEVGERVAAIDELIGELDTCFMLGFSRLGAEQAEALAATARVFTGTPLQEALASAVEGITRAEFREEHFRAIAAARSSLQGAQYDALLDAAAEATGQVRVPTALGEAPATPGPIANWMSSTRQWLVEVALAGFLQLDHQTITPFVATSSNSNNSPRPPAWRCFSRAWSTSSRTRHRPPGSRWCPSAAGSICGAGR